MAIRLIVEARNIRASVSHTEAKLVAPEFTRASVSVARPIFETITSSITLEAVTSYIALRSLTSHVDLQSVNIRLDPDSLNKYLRDDTVSFLHEVTLHPTKGLDDQFGFVVADPIFNFTKAPSDTFELLEDVNVLLTFLRDFTDSFGFADVPALTVSRPVADTFGFTDAIQTIDTEKGLSDTTTFAEDIQKSLDFDFGSISSVAFVDVASLHLSLTMPTDTFGMTDVLTFANEYFRNLTDSASISDAAPVFTVNAVRADTFEFTDLAAKDVTTVLTDTPSMQDVFSRTVDYNRTETDVYTFAHDVTFDNSLGKTDTFSMADAPALDVTSSQEDSFGIADSPALHPSISDTDTFTFGDVLSRVVSFSRTFSDSFTLDDAATVDAFAKDYEGVKGNIVSITETLSFSMQQQIADSFSFTDVPAISLSTSASDSVSFAEAVTIDGTYQLSDTATMSDSLTSHLADTSSSVINADAFNLGTFNV